MRVGRKHRAGAFAEVLTASGGPAASPTINPPRSPRAGARSDKCGSPGCALVIEFVDGRGAHATGPNAAAGAGSDYTPTTAENRALAQRRSAGGNCQVQVWTL